MSIGAATDPWPQDPTFVLIWNPMVFLSLSSTQNCSTNASVIQSGTDNGHMSRCRCFGKLRLRDKLQYTQSNKPAQGSGSDYQPI